MNNFKMMFLILTFMGTITSVSSYTWMGMWMGLEINLLSIIPLMMNKKNVMSAEAAMKYFITQALASTILLFSVILMMYEFNSINNLNVNSSKILILNSSLLTKMGAAPFHFWFPEVMEGLSWNNCLLLLTWQKIAPMILLMYNSNMIYFMTTIIIFSMLISGFMGIMQSSLRKILAYSSINHIAWMLSSMIFMEMVWVYYFIIYSIISLNLILILKMFNLFFINQVINMKNMNNYIKTFFIMNFLSLGGLPPFLGFFPKWLTIQIMVNNKLYLTSLIMVIMTLITLYFYMRISFSALILKTSELKWMILNIKNQKTFMILIFNMISMMGLILCTLIFNWM